MTFSAMRGVWVAMTAMVLSACGPGTSPNDAGGTMCPAQESVTPGGTCSTPATQRCDSINRVRTCDGTQGSFVGCTCQSGQWQCDPNGPPICETDAGPMDSGPMDSGSTTCDAATCGDASACPDIVGEGDACTFEGMTCSGPALTCPGGGSIPRPCTCTGGQWTCAPVDCPQPQDAGPISCGTMTCAPNQACVLGCSGIDSGTDLHHCVDIPSSCGGTVSCGCIDACPAGQSCRETGSRNIECEGCA